MHQAYFASSPEPSLDLTPAEDVFVWLVGRGAREVELCEGRLATIVLFLMYPSNPIMFWGSN